MKSFIRGFVIGKKLRIFELNEELQKDSNLDQRTRTVFNYLTNSSSQTVNKSEVSEAVADYLLKYRLLESYIPDGKLSRDIHLLEDPSQILPNEVSIIKEIFTQLCSGKVTVHRVFSPRLLSDEDGVKRLATTLQSIV